MSVFSPYLHFFCQVNQTYFNFTRRKQESELSELGNLVARLQSTLDDRDLDEQARITPALEALEKAREENIRLSSRLEEVLNKNTQLSDDLNKTKVSFDSILVCRIS